MPYFVLGYRSCNDIIVTIAKKKDIEGMEYFRIYATNHVQEHLGGIPQDMDTLSITQFQ